MRYRSVTLAAVVAGTGVCALAFHASCPGSVRTLHFSSDYVPENVQFRRVMSAAEAGPDGIIGDAYTFRASDCVTVDTVRYKFSDADRAIEQTQKLLGGGEVLLVQTPGPESQRAIMRSRNGHYIIVSREASDLLMIDSSSLSHALVFEKRNLEAKAAGS